MSWDSLIGKVWITGTTTLISFISLTSQIFIIVPLFRKPFYEDYDCLRLLIPFNLLVTLVYLNYFLCVFTDPGRVPKNYDPNLDFTDFNSRDDDENGRKLLEDKRYLLKEAIRFCKVCKVYKPPRSHHCKHCKRCILKMDHHCPWVNNCIGYYNHGHFIRFLISVDFACWYHIWLISKRVFGEFAYGPEPSKRELIFLILNYVACLPVILTVGVFSIYHIWVLVTNQTTIEGWEIDKANQLRRRGRIHQFTYPFGLGSFKNIQFVLGKNPLLWWLPQRITGNGLKYHTAKEIDPLEQYLWPPRDLFTRRVTSANRQRFKSDSFKAFTYGDERLNPNLVPTGSSSSQSNITNNVQIYKRRSAPYVGGDGSEEEEEEVGGEGFSMVPLLKKDRHHRQGRRYEDEDESEEDGIDSDDQPLGHLIDQRLRKHQQQSFSESGAVNHNGYEDLEDNGSIDRSGRNVRVRRGSEGYEVRSNSWSIQNLRNSDCAEGLVRNDGWYDHQINYEDDEGSEGSL